MPGNNAINIRENSLGYSGYCTALTAELNLLWDHNERSFHFFLSEFEEEDGVN